MKILLLFIISLVLVAFGQPSFSHSCALLASICGFAPLLYVLRNQSPKRRFWYGTLFFSLVQLIQLFWLTSHPYAYIYLVWVGLSFLMGLQFGCITLAATQAQLLRFSGALFIASLWTLMEWSRLFFLTGFTFNPIGLAAASNPLLLQSAALVGIYGLSFLVALINCLITRVLIEKSFRACLYSFLAIFIPLCFGAFRFNTKDTHPAPNFKTIIIQTRIMPEELEIDGGRKNLVEEGLQTWKAITQALEPYRLHAPYDLILLPEIVVPYDGQAPMYLLEKVSEFIHSPLSPIGFTADNIAYVSSYAISSALADELKTPFLTGLE
ncbi:MAG TPA: hypothetical protein VN457_00885, partial [Chlamydiales bacterium]|nr:hypothetical protein [Chlamydiales bacterium]